MGGGCVREALQTELIEGTIVLEVTETAAGQNGQNQVMMILEEN